MDSDLLKIILQIETLIDAAKGLPNNPVPDGINPANEGSTFDTKHVSPILSSNERSRVKRIAEIFKEVFSPRPEAERIQIDPKPTREQNITQNVKLSLDGKDLGNEKGGILSSLLGATGEMGGLVGAAKLAIIGLAAALGISSITLAGGKAFQWFVEGLKAAQGIDWKGVSILAKTFTGVIKDIVSIVKDFITHFIGLGVDIAKMAIDTIKGGVEFAVYIVDKFGKTVKTYRDIEWSDLLKAGTAIAGFMGIMAGMGIPPVALFQALGNAVFAWGNINFRAFSNNIGLFASSMDKLFSVIDDNRGVDFLDFANILLKAFSIIGGLAAISFTAPLTMLGAFTAQVASLGLDSIGKSFILLSAGIEKLGKAQHIFAEGIKQLEGLDPKQLVYLSEGVSKLGASMVGFGVGSAFANFFKSDELRGIIMLADRHLQLHNASTAVRHLSDGFKTWSNLPLHHLSYNLEKIQKSVSKLDSKKLQQTFKSTISYTPKQDPYTKATYAYIVTGNDKRDGGNGLLSVTKDILQENKKLNATIIKIKDMLVEIESNQKEIKPASLMDAYMRPVEGRRTTETNPRDALRPLGIR